MCYTIRRRLPVFAAIFALLAMASCGGNGGGGQTLRLSLILGDNSDWYRGAARFAELVGERSGGQWQIRIYPLAQLAGQDQRTELEMLQSGVIDLSMESSILLSVIEPRMSVLSLPWLFDSYAEADSILDGPLGDELLAALPPKGIVGLAYGVNGFRQLTNSRNPVARPEDMREMKIRVPGIRLYIDMFRLLGADPSSMNFGELFTALAQGTMDGEENPLSVIVSSRLYEVQKYLTVWSYSYDPVLLCMNGRLWDSLDAGTRQLFTECAREAMVWQRDLVASGEPALLDSLRVLGMEVETPGPEAVAAFSARTEPAYRTWSEELGGDIVERFRAAAGHSE